MGMSGFGRWTIRDAFGAPWTFVIRARASEDERARALSQDAARRAIDRMFGRPSDVDWPVLLDLSGVPALDVRHHTCGQLRELIRRRVGPLGPLLLLGGRPGTATKPMAATTGPEPRLIAAVMNRDDLIAFEGRHYRLANAAAARASRDQFEVVPPKEARGLMARLGAVVTHARRDTLKEAADRLVDPLRHHGPGGLVLLRRIVRPRVGVPPAAPAITPSALRAATRRDITLRFVEAGTGRPISGAPLTLAGPDGGARRLTTSSAGLVTLAELEPGRCVATSIIASATADASFVPGAPGRAAPSEGGDASPIPRSWLVEVDEYRVRAGDTPASVARDAGLPWDDIAWFNWKTTDPAALQDAFRDEVGCTKKTADGKSYAFDDRDEPGIILIPRPWTASFAIGMAHTILVAPLRRVHISLENESGVRIPGAGYEVVLADGSVRQGRLGRSGIACLAGVPEGAFSVAYPDQQDLLARSLAASTRRAFDEQGTGPLFFLLGQEQSIVDRAVAVYEEYFDDLSGRGLAADIDQVVTDPDARPPLVLLCALAGLPIEGTSGVTVEGAARDTADG